MATPLVDWKVAWMAAQKVESKAVQMAEHLAAERADLWVEWRAYSKVARSVGRWVFQRAALRAAQMVATMVVHLAC